METIQGLEQFLESDARSASLGPSLITQDELPGNCRLRDGVAYFSDLTKFAAFCTNSGLTHRGGLR